MDNENEFLKELDNKDENGFQTDGNPFDNIELPVKEDEPVEEKPVPFHKDEKVQKYVQKQIEKALREHKPETEVQQFIKDTEGEDLVSAFTTIIGNDTPEKQQALRMLKKTVSDLEEKALAPLKQIEAERLAEQKATEELDNGLDGIEETFDVDITSNAPSAKKMRSEFMDFVTKVSPKNRNGDVTALPDLEATFELFQSTRKKPDNSRAKELANRSMSRSSDASNVPVQKDTSWDSVSRFLDSLRK